MFAKQVAASNRSFSKDDQKIFKPSRSFSKENGVTKRRHDARPRRSALTSSTPAGDVISSNPGSAIVTLVVGTEQRLFAAHQHILCSSPFFKTALSNIRPNPGTQRISLPDEQPEILSSVLEFLYKGDYHPRVIHDPRHDSWELESPPASHESVVYHRGEDEVLLKDTLVYCAAEKYGLDELKKLALRKQGLQSGIQCSTILASARYAYANTPENDSKLRAHFLALIIRSRSVFKRSGTMQMDMFNGGTQLFFDLFVALCNHVDDVACRTSFSEA